MPEAFKRCKLSLFNMLICLTFLFVAWQIVFFIIHYQVSTLIDSLVNSSLAIHFLSPVIVLPLVEFIFLQILGYLLFILWIWFNAKSIGAMLGLSDAHIYFLGVGLFFIACILLLSLNNYYFPGSFFSILWREVIATNWMQQVFFMGALFIFLLAGLLSYIHFFCYQQHRTIGSIFLLLLFIIGMFSFYERFPLLEEKPKQGESFMPNVIIIGLDSLRPDFIHYLGNNEIKTPYLDHFLKHASLFTEAYTPLARTFPAWISILTGKYPLHSGVRNNLAQSTSIINQATLAKYLKRQGYETIYATDEKRFSNITKDYGFDRILGPNMGIDDFIIGSLSDFPLTNLLVNLPFGHFLFRYHYANRAASVTYQPEHFLHLLKRDLRARSDKPLFLAVHFCLTHWPFTWAHKGQQGGGLLGSQYQSSIEAEDKQVGQFLQLLREENLLQHSLLLILSDHGTTLGLAGDRSIDKKKYRGKAKNLTFLTVSRYSHAPQDSMDFKNDYSINTSYGQGTDVLSLKQFSVLLAFRGYGINLPAKKIPMRANLIDIAPTILDFLHLPPMQDFDGQSLLSAIEGKSQERHRPMYIETGDTIGDILQAKIDMSKVVQERIQAYDVDPRTGYLYLNKQAEQSLIKNKQRGIIFGDWLLAFYPPQIRMRLAPIAESLPRDLILESYILPPQYILVNLRTGKWTIGLHSAFSKVTLLALKHQLEDFYKEEVS